MNRCLTAWWVLLAFSLGLSACSSTGQKITPELIARYSVADFSAPIASAAGQAEQLADARAKIARALAEDASSAELAQGLGAVQFFGVQVGAEVGEQGVGAELLRRALPRLGAMSAAEQRGVLSAAHTLAPGLAAPLVVPLLGAIATPREFAIASHVVLRAAGADAAQLETARAAITTAMNTRFAALPNEIGSLDGGEPRLLALRAVLDGAAHAAARPPLGDLLRAPLVAGLPVVYSFQRQGRQHFGLVMVRGVDGKFVRNADGSYFALPQLALALTELPGTLTNGNTPQGLFTIVGAGIATNKWIGPTPYIESRVPIEATVAEFEHSASASAQATVTWSHERYTAMLPPSWRGYWPFQEAYLAGRAGRNEMIIHGTTIDSGSYQGRSYYPGTPSAGCLVAMESWDKQTGQLIQSDQLSLLRAFTKGGTDRGHLVVVELDAKAAPVVLADVIGEVDATTR